VNDVNCNVTVRDIADAVCAQSNCKGKSAGPMDFLRSLLSMRDLNCGFTLVFLPHTLNTASFLTVLCKLLLPLTDKNYYRAIALSNVDIKIFERLLLSKTKESVFDGDKYQFGFKAGHSTSMCTGLSKS